MTQQTLCLHSDTVFKSPGTQPPAQLASWLPEWPTHVPWVTRGKHSSTGLKILGRGRVLWLLNMMFIKRTSSLPVRNQRLFHTHAISCHAYLLSIPAPHFPSRCHSSALFTPLPSLPDSWGGEGRGGHSWPPTLADYFRSQKVPGNESESYWQLAWVRLLSIQDVYIAHVCQGHFTTVRRKLRTKNTPQWMLAIRRQRKKKT